MPHWLCRLACVPGVQSSVAGSGQPGLPSGSCVCLSHGHGLSGLTLLPGEERGRGFPIQAAPFTREGSAPCRKGVCATDGGAPRPCTSPRVSVHNGATLTRPLESVSSAKTRRALAAWVPPASPTALAALTCVLSVGVCSGHCVDMKAHSVRPPLFPRPPLLAGPR